MNVFMPLEEKMFNVKLIVFGSVLVFLLSLSCRKPKGNDKEIYQIVQNKLDFKYIRLGDFIPTNAASGHTQPFYRTRLNSIAWSVWNGQTPLSANTKFPEGSVIIKDLYEVTSGNPELYAVMEKKDGVWRWAEFNRKGKVVVSSEKGIDKCQGCHTTGIDFTRGL